MIEELVDSFASCDIEVVAVEQLSLPLTQEGKHRILVVPSYNIAEMLEEILEEEEKSLAEVVDRELKEVHSLSIVDTFRRIAESILVDADLPLEQKNLEGKSFEDIYAAYALVWAGHEMLNEKMAVREEEIKIETEATSVLTTEWVREKIEAADDVIILTLPAGSGYEAPLWVPMGGYNECPLPVYQSAVFKHWQEQYHVTPLAVTQDKWVLQAGTRPLTYEAALRLAKEHFIFCQYVLERFDTLGHYAVYLMGNNEWDFWWD
ncbi:DUF4253 domain-containing protein [Paenibacillus sp. NPDC058177]|uniref:DUF4253 domain-containing protein n=1 Tax=Paenibacillus sp. NPDC058177 TaxID=3346369 RepID=UPI0036D98DBA